MNKRLTLFFLLFIVTVNCFSQATFQKRYGGHKNETMLGLTSTYDGGYVMTGESQSFGDTLGDIYLLKTDSLGNLLWSKIYHGALQESCNSVIETADHGLLLAGYTYSFGAGTFNAVLLKTDSVGGMQWAKVYGGTQGDYFSRCTQVHDGGYIAIGGTTSYGSGDDDILIVRTNANGDTLWTRIIGGTAWDQGVDIIETADSNFAFSGREWSYSIGAWPNGCLFKLSSSGDTLWTTVFGGSGQEEGMSLKQTSDGGYIVTGDSRDSFKPGYDAYLNRFDSTGHLLWSKLYGGASTDATYKVVIMSDGGFSLLGFTNSFGTPQARLYHGSNSNLNAARTTGDNGSNTWLIRTDANGDTLWTREYGGPLQDESYGLVKTYNDGLVLLGFSDSFGLDSTDVYLIKTDASGKSGCYESRTNPVVINANTMVRRAPMNIISGVMVASAPFTQITPPTFQHVICEFAGVDEEAASEQGLLLYPNPVSDELIIKNENSEIGIIEIYNVLGQKASPPTSLQRRGETVSIDISHLAAGVYFLKVLSKESQWIGRFIRE